MLCLCGERCLSLLRRTIFVATILALLCADAIAFSIKHDGMIPQWQTRRNDKVGRSTSCTRLASSNQLHVSVTVDTTVTVSTRSIGGTSTVSTSSGSASSTSTFASIETPISETELGLEDESGFGLEDGSEDEADAVPMDTPARQSMPSHLCLRSIPGKGFGVITLKPFAEGEFVGEYKGEVMFEDVKDRRYLPSLKDLQTDEDRQWIQTRQDRGQTLTGCYLYGISLPPNYKGQTAARIYVDAEDEYESLWTRFINHASPPCNNVNPKSIHESYDGNPRVWFLANRDIEEGEEICFDYGDDYWLEGDEVY